MTIGNEGNKIKISELPKVLQPIAQKLNWNGDDFLTSIEVDVNGDLRLDCFCAVAEEYHWGDKNLIADFQKELQLKGLISFKNNVCCTTESSDCPAEKNITLDVLGLQYLLNNMPKENLARGAVQLLVKGGSLAVPAIDEAAYKGGKEKSDAIILHIWRANKGIRIEGLRYPFIPPLEFRSNAVKAVKSIGGSLAVETLSDMMLRVSTYYQLAKDDGEKRKEVFRENLQLVPSLLDAAGEIGICHPEAAVEVLKMALEYAAQSGKDDTSLVWRWTDDYMIKYRETPAWVGDIIDAASKLNHPLVDEFLRFMKKYEVSVIPAWPDNIHHRKTVYFRLDDNQKSKIDQILQERTE